MRQTILWVIVVIGIAGSVPGTAFADEAAEEYEKWLGRYDLVGEPQKHEVLAKWCARNYPEREAFHQEAYHRFLFGQEEARLSADPVPSRLKLMHERAIELDLKDEARGYLQRWGEGQFAVHAAKLKPGDLTMQKQLLAWCEREGVGFIESSRQLAHQIIEAEPDYEDARILLEHVRWDGGWMSLEEAIGQADLKDIQQRKSLHRAAAETRSKRPPHEYPENPLAGMAPEGKRLHYFSPAQHPEARMYLSVIGYSASQPTPLIVSLHGGGSGGQEVAFRYAATAGVSFNGSDTPLVVLAPAATSHVANSWGTASNVEEIFDAMEEVCSLFNIDRTRIYVTGVSMGGGGTTIWLSSFPEMAAAYAGCAGFFWTRRNHRDLLGKPILIIQGEKDEPFRVESRHKVVEMFKERNAVVEELIYPEHGHFLPHYIDQIRVDFFGKHQNDIEPDFTVMKAAIGVWLR